MPTSTATPSNRFFRYLSDFFSAFRSLRVPGDISAPYIDMSACQTTGEFWMLKATSHWNWGLVVGKLPNPSEWTPHHPTWSKGSWLEMLRGSINIHSVKCTKCIYDHPWFYLQGRWKRRLNWWERKTLLGNLGIVLAGCFQTRKCCEELKSFLSPRFRFQLPGYLLWLILIKIQGQV